MAYWQTKSYAEHNNDVANIMPSSVETSPLNAIVTIYVDGQLKQQPLTPLQTRFVEAYVSNGFDIGQAAISAGYNAKNLSIANSMGKECLIKPHVRAYVNYLLDKQANIARPALIEHHIRTLNTDITDMYQEHTDDKGNVTLKLKPLKDLTKEQKMLVDSIKPTRYGSEIKTLSKSDAIAHLAKIVGITQDKTEVNVTQNNLTTIKRVIVSANQQSEIGQNPPIIEHDSNE